jgi:protocatechuate 3,4-dioxygenase beta subunit
VSILKRQRMLVVLMALGAALIAILWYFPSGNQGESGDTAPIAPLSSAERESTGSAAQLPAIENPVEGSEGDSAGNRVLEAAIRFRITDELGTPVEGAQVSWSPLLADSADEIPDLAEVDIQGLVDQTLRSDSDDEGHAEFKKTPTFAHSATTVVWVTCPGYLAEYVVIEAVRDNALGTVLLTMDRATSFEARVVDGNGDVVTDARIFQAGVSAGEARQRNYRGGFPTSGADDSLPAALAARSFCRVYDVNFEGLVDIAFGEWPSVVWAKRGPLISQHFLVRPERKTATLRLGHPVSVSGTVTMKEGGGIPDGLAIKCGWMRSGMGESFGMVRVHQDGSWGPVEIPNRKEGEYKFRLRGGGVVLQEELRPLPREVDNLRVDFVAEIGVSQDVQLEDDQGDPVVGARVEICWQEEDRWLRSIGWSDEDGLASIDGCRETTIWVLAMKKGYVDTRSKGTGIPRPVEDLTLIMERAGGLAGRVTHDGEPVTGFQVMTWVSNPRTTERYPFFDRLDGRFEMESVPIGHLKVMVASHDLPESEVQTVEIEAGSVAEIEVELSSGVCGYGSVVDAASGDPIPDARVQLWSCFSSWVLADRGVKEPVLATGEFQLEGVSPRESAIEVSAPGYVSERVRGTVDDAGLVDFGVTPLAGYQTLNVHLSSNDPIDTTGVWFSGSGKQNIPFVKIPEDGHLAIPDIAPGGYHLTVTMPDLSGQTRYVRLAAGEKWDVEFPFPQALSIEVRIHPQDGEELPSDLALWVAWEDDSGTPQHRGIVVSEGGLATLTHMPATLATFLVDDDNSGDVVALTQVLLQPPGPQIVDLFLTGQGLRVKVVDDQGTPLQSGVVYVSTTDTELPWGHKQAVHSNGIASFGGLDLKSIDVIARATGHGLARRRATLDPDGMTDIEIVLDCDEKMLLSITDQGEPVGGVEVLAAPVDFEGTTILSGTTNAAGEQEWSGIPDDTYLLRLSRYGYWPVAHMVHFTGQSSIPLPIRRRGKLEAIITTPSDTPIPGAQLTLYSVEFDTTVATWLAEGKLESSAAALQSDAKGRVFAHGIPHGVYDWTVTTPDGAVTSGQVTIPPGETLETSFQIGG